MPSAPRTPGTPAVSEQKEGRAATQERQGVGPEMAGCGNRATPGAHSRHLNLSQMHLPVAAEQAKLPGCTSIHTYSLSAGGGGSRVPGQPGHLREALSSKIRRET